MATPDQSPVKSLIDRASVKLGTRYKLAKALGVVPTQVYDWESGKKPCSPADRARIAAFAGEDAVQELVRATLETARGEVRRKQLEQVLGKLSRAIGVVAVIASLVLASLSFGSRDVEGQAAFS